MKYVILITSVVIFITGCAGSATHDVLTTYEANDMELSCNEINTEIVKAQEVIDAVNQDKEDISGADVIDGVLWFPFNLIAKSSNYNNALEAASNRIERLELLKEEKQCSD